MKSRDSRPRAWNSSLPAPSKPMNRGGPVRSDRTTAPSRKPLKSRKPLPKVNVERQAKDVPRKYGPVARRRWVKSLPCIYCVTVLPILAQAIEWRCENAHVETAGKGYKADYTKIVPLCHTHHTRYDRHLPPFDHESVRQAIKDCAPRIEAAWQAHLARSGSV
jgi:hypothetical protein